MSIVCVCMWKRYPRFDQKPKLNWSNTNLFYCISNKSWTERKATKITTQMSTCLVFYNIQQKMLITLAREPGEKNTKSYLKKRETPRT